MAVVASDLERSPSPFRADPRKIRKKTTSARSRAAVAVLIAELKASFTIAIVTHNMEQAGRVADTTAFILNGELIEHTPTATIFTMPSDPRTEQYITGRFG